MSNDSYTTLDVATVNSMSICGSVIPSTPNAILFVTVICPRMMMVETHRYVYIYQELSSYLQLLELEVEDSKWRAWAWPIIFRFLTYDLMWINGNSRSCRVLISTQHISTTYHFVYAPRRRFIVTLFYEMPHWMYMRNAFMNFEWVTFLRMVLQWMDKVNLHTLGGISKHKKVCGSMKGVSPSPSTPHYFSWYLSRAPLPLVLTPTFLYDTINKTMVWCFNLSYISSTTFALTCITMEYQSIRYGFWHPVPSNHFHHYHSNHFSFNVSAISCSVWLLPWNIASDIGMCVLHFTLLQCYFMAVSVSKIKQAPWASWKIRIIAGCACAVNAGNVFPAISCYQSRHASRHVRDVRAVMHAGCFTTLCELPK